MLKSMRRIALVAGALALVAAYALPAEAQTTPVNIGQENFDGGVGTWALSAPTGGVGWAMDNTANAGNSAPNSLNYNNGTNYNSGGINQGAARSPVYTIASATYTTFTVSFMCRRHTEIDLNNNLGFRVNNHDTCVVNVYDSISAAVPIYDIQLYDVSYLALAHMTLGIGNEPCTIDTGWHTHTLAIPVPVGTVAVEFVFNTVDNLYNDGAGWYVDDLAINAVDPGGGVVPPPPGYQGPGYNADGIWVGFPDGGGGTPPGAVAGTGTPVETGYFDANGVFIGTGTGVANPGAPAGTGTPVETGSLNANGIYVGAPGSSGGGGGGGGGDKCGLMGLEFLLPLGLLRLLRRRR